MSHFTLQKAEKSGLKVIRLLHLFSRPVARLKSHGRPLHCCTTQYQSQKWPNGPVKHENKSKIQDLWCMACFAAAVNSKPSKLYATMLRRNY